MWPSRSKLGLLAPYGGVAFIGLLFAVQVSFSGGSMIVSFAIFFHVHLGCYSICSQGPAFDYFGEMAGLKKPVEK